MRNFFKNMKRSLAAMTIAGGTLLAATPGGCGGMGEMNALMQTLQAGAEMMNANPSLLNNLVNSNNAYLDDNYYNNDSDEYYWP